MWTANSIWQTHAKRSGICGVARTVAELKKETEVRGYLFRSSYKRGNDLTDPSSGATKHYLAAVATFGAGLSFLF